MGALKHSSRTRFDTKFALPGDVVAENASTVVTVTKDMNMKVSSKRETRVDRLPECPARAIARVGGEPYQRAMG